MKYDCLIVDDEEMLSINTKEYFNLFDVKTAWADSRDACLDFFRKNEADIILLDINLGNASGFELCKHLRQTINAPILFISARTSDDDMLLALNIGGDDYIKKPYSLAVLLAKVKAVLKRHKGNKTTEDILYCGNLCIDTLAKTVSVNKGPVLLKSMEFKLLVFLVQHKNAVVPKEEIFKNVWGDAFSEDNTLNVHIRRLREKIEDNPNEPRYIKTIRGTGYMFDETGSKP